MALYYLSFWDERFDEAAEGTKSGLVIYKVSHSLHSKIQKSEKRYDDNTFLYIEMLISSHF